MKKTVILITSLALLTGFTGSDARLTQRQRALHALNRLAFGARPGDVDRVMKDGVDVWIERQLHPELIPDRAIGARLATYATLQMSSSEITRKFFAPIQAARKEAKAMAADGKPVDQEELRKQFRANLPPDQRPQRVMDELQSQRILRAAESDRQLNEVMVDFWMNHFNVFAGKGLDRFLLTSYERDTIRPRVWGRFEDMLMATAKSPAMLFYLDNALSVADPANRSAQNQRGGWRGGYRGGYYRRQMLDGDAMPRPQQQNPRKGGLNENYAREIMELHTLGVDGGYTQKDVTELARVFTGWTIDRPQQGGGFVFRAQLHDIGEKTVMGIHFPAGGGMEEGERMIRVLAHQPATAHHIAYKLCQRLVADEPPPALVDRVAKKFLATDGDLRQTVRAVIDSPEFWDPQYYRGKVKSPFEYAISAVRVIDATIVDPLPMAKGLQQVGEPLYGAQPPTGYSDKADAWVNTGALLNRLNFALNLASNKVPGVRSDVTLLIPVEAASDADRSVDALAEALTGGGLTEETRSTIKDRVGNLKGSSDDPWDNTQMPLIAGLILGSPEFQKQ
jgi:uncharacterized protein (DUF1800 family)